MTANFRRLLPLGTALIFVATLAACQSAEEQAESHYQSALELLEQGDLDRAIVEFRNTFQDNPRHKEARLAFASMMADRGVNIIRAHDVKETKQAITLTQAIREV